MATNQNLRQASVRASTGTSYVYNDDWMALFTAAGFTTGTFNDRMKAWINGRLSTSYLSLNDAQKAFAINQGFTSWNEMGTFTANGTVLSLPFSTMSTGADLAAKGVTFARASTATYYNSSGILTTAASGAPRFDYDPSTLQPKGLLIEESRVNQLLYSQDFSNAAWSKAGATVTANAAVAPDGTLTAAKVDLIATSFGLYQLVTRTITAGTSQTISAWLRADTPQTVLIGFNGGANPLNNTGTSVNVTTQWQRFSFTTTASTNDSGLYCFAASTHIDNSVVADIAATRSVYVWGAQYEGEASFATSYILTTSASVTRAVDAASVPIPASVSNIRHTYSDNTTADVVVTPLATYNFPTGKTYKSTVSV